MKKIYSFFLLVIAVIYCGFNSVLACSTTSTTNSKISFSIAEFDTNDTSFNTNIEYLNALKHSILPNSYLFNSSIIKELLIDNIKNNTIFNEYLTNKLDCIFEALVNFTLKKPELFKYFGPSNPENIENFFKLFITVEDIKKCLITSLNDINFSNILTYTNFCDFFDCVYNDVEKILRKDNLEDLFEVMYTEIQKDLLYNNLNNLHTIIYTEIQNVLAANCSETLIDNIYSKVVNTLTINI